MTPIKLSQREPDLTGLRVLVLGAGRSGLAALRLAAARGASVRLTDRRSEAELGKSIDDARKLGAALALGDHPLSLLDETDLIVLSPGVPGNIELLEAAREREIPIWGEIELAARFCRGRVIGITGSNGKSTVTSMIGHILREAGIPGGTGGNLATPFCDLLEQDSPQAIHAVELSSFQLETVEAFRPEVSVVLNLSEDHLDRYDSYEDYARAKARILEVQGPDDAAVLNADDAESERFVSCTRGRKYFFSTRREAGPGAFLNDGRLVLWLDDETVELMHRSELSLPGEHNVANALAAALAVRLVGCPEKAIRHGLTSFRGLRHRLEPVGSLNGVDFFNDSKATNPASALRALGSFDAGKVHLILGGKEKGADWAELAQAVATRAKQVLLIGESSEKIRSLLGPGIRTVDCGSMDRAVTEAFRTAETGDVVLLSPACASFDQYRNFEERGDDFRRLVDELTENGGVADA